MSTKLFTPIWKKWKEIFENSIKNKNFKFSEQEVMEQYKLEGCQTVYKVSPFTEYLKKWRHSSKEKYINTNIQIMSDHFLYLIIIDLSWKAVHVWGVVPAIGGGPSVGGGVREAEVGDFPILIGCSSISQADHVGVELGCFV